jgi:hypothetical protein
MWRGTYVGGDYPWYIALGEVVGVVENCLYD